MRGNRGYKLTPQSQSDLEDIWRYSFENWSREQADRYSLQLRDACFELANGTRKGRQESARPGYLKYTSGAHIIFYRESGDHIEVIRVLHGSMDANRNL